MRFDGLRLYTIGHSTLPLDELVRALHRFEVGLLADVRTIPRSRHNPQYDGATLGSDLASASIRYLQLPALGGLRHPRKDSPNAGWRNSGFRGYADHMGSAEFERGLEQLRPLAEQQTVALMCAEAVPWRCHRSLLADALVVRGARVEHIVGGQARSHRLTPFAVVEGERLTYPSPEARGVTPLPASGHPPP